jgi:hypothetical protein
MAQLEPGCFVDVHGSYYECLKREKPHSDWWYTRWVGGRWPMRHTSFHTCGFTKPHSFARWMTRKDGRLGGSWLLEHIYPRLSLADYLKGREDIERERSRYQQIDLPGTQCPE